ncbi:hypothetical protein SEA_BILLNYE_234 [Streptomyces phage BillNye]|uniref:Uncharacterized protein n=1 Tax=Streptomyces phage BillNye TaxID=2079426 RepID=A0A2L1IW77_9CAUD|nr:hypothetical protein FDJ30_gp028 [Streptomyces phage BillNye]AVD99405.1 hypothetical protein SEA_BILLNYE_234 [Streptomyces phage BillNye]
MAQGIWINGERPKSKKAIREAVETNPAMVDVEATSLHGGEYGGPLHQAPEGTMIVFVGPDPYKSRKFYGTITKFNGELHIS